MNQWIKCSDRMPDDNQRVLAFDGHIEVVTHWRGRFDMANGDFGGRDISENVTHWMPLPPTPAGDKA